MLIRYMLAWAALAVIAIANGILREVTYGRTLPESTAHQLSTLTAIIFSGFFVWWLSRLGPLESGPQAWLVGFIWLVLTVTFEFGFGHFVAGHSWTHLFADYNLLAGRVWLLFLVWVTVMPYIFYKLR